MILFITVNSIKVRGWRRLWCGGGRLFRQSSIFMWIQSMRVDYVNKHCRCVDKLLVFTQWRNKMSWWLQGLVQGSWHFPENCLPSIILLYVPSINFISPGITGMFCFSLCNLLSHAMLHLGHWMSPGWLRFIWATRFDKMEPTSLRSDPLWSTPATAAAATGINCGT